MFHVTFYMLHVTPWYMLSMYSTAVLKSSHLRVDLCAVLSLICRVVLTKMMRKEFSARCVLSAQWNVLCAVQCGL